MSDSDNGRTATDIITYIGVPLAVLGVLPILYNTVATLAALSKIRRMLRRAKLTALTRSDVVNKVIEVELPRYAVTPLNRFEESAEYWHLSQQPSQIPGGSWTTFNWKTNTIGIKTQRVEYADQLRQPQVEVGFDELVSYLLDLGAVPDAQGWKLLRSTGLWTPTGCALMTSPTGQKALSIAPLDDSDGHLSLAVSWSSSWTNRDFSSLPPYWVRLPPPTVRPKTATSGEASSTKDTDSGVDGKEIPADKQQLKDGKSPRQSMDSIQRQMLANARTTITCQISVEGLVTALSQEVDVTNTNSNPQSLYIEHLRIRSGRSVGMWFSSAATAYGTTSQTVLWNYKIPDEILRFTQKDTVPCGILVLLGVVDESDTPQWATAYNHSQEAHELFVRRGTEQRLAMAEENRMPPAQRQAALENRRRREMEQMMQDMRDKTRLEQQRREARQAEAMQSPKWETKLVAEHNLKWLQARGHIEASLGLKDVVGSLLHRMVLDGEFASAISRMLDLWKAWSDNGGMRISDFNALRDDQETFAKASLLLSMIKDSTGANQGTLAMDLQECMTMWRTVRLG